MKEGYPIKYGVLELKAYEDPHNICSHERVEGYIVSKCSVIRSETIYGINEEDTITRYEVIFPCKNYNDYKKGWRNYTPKITIPKEEVDHRWTTTSTIYVFNTEKEATAVAKKLNDALWQRTLFNLSKLDKEEFRDEYKSAIDKYRSNLKDCGSFERVLTKATEDLEITSNEKAPIQKQKILI